MMLINLAFKKTVTKNNFGLKMLCFQLWKGLSILQPPITRSSNNQRDKSRRDSTGFLTTICTKIYFGTKRANPLLSFKDIFKNTGRLLKYIPIMFAYVCKFNVSLINQTSLLGPLADLGDLPHKYIWKVNSVSLFQEFQPNSFLASKHQRLDRV